MIRVHDELPYGNVCRSEVRELGQETEIRFAAHPHGGPEALWFCFRMESSTPIQAGHVFRLLLQFPETLLGGPEAENCHPVYRFDEGPWRRMAAGEREIADDGQPSWSWRIDGVAEARRIDVALCYPYGPEEVQQLIEDTQGAWSASDIGVSQSGRPITRLANRLGRPGGEEPGLYFVSRQHSGETPGTWVLDGTMRRFAEMGGEAPLVWYVPFANIDGVMQGDYGKDNFPYDLNRAWSQPPMRFENSVIMQDMRRWSQRCTPCAAFDSHAPGWTEIAGVYAFDPVREDTAALGASVELAARKMVEQLTPAYAAADFLRVARYASRWETPNFATFMLKRFQIPSMSFETPYSRVGEKVLTVEDYREIGRRIADGIVDYIRK